MNANDFIRKMPWWQKLLGAIVVVIVTLGFLINEDPANRRERLAKTSNTTNETPSIQVGQVVQLQENVIAGRTEEDWDEISDAIRADDSYGWLEKIDNGTAFALQKGQKVKRLDYGIQMVKIRVMEGPNAGASCYVAAEYLTGNFK